MALDPLEQGRLRLAIFAALERLIEARGGFATLNELVNFEIDGRRMGLIDRNRGIRNPRELDSTLSVVTSEKGPYPDEVQRDGLLRYSHRLGDPIGGDHLKLRVAMVQKTPIILFQKPIPNVYVPTVPAYVIEEHRDERFFLIAVDESAWRARREGSLDGIERRYVEQTVRRRVHQPVFRARVMVAYEGTCAVCRLMHPELLDAAHITADSEFFGVPTVTNGLALCKLHHAAYDQNLLGISGDYRVHINAGLLDEVDGPMLRHGLQDMHGSSLTIPRRKADRPSPERLEARFEMFRN